MTRKERSSKSSNPAIVFVSAVVVFPGEKAVEVFVFLHINNGSNRLGKQTGIRRHVPPVVSGFIERPVRGGDWVWLVATGGTGKVEKLFHFGVLGDDLAIVPQVKQVIRMQAVLLVDVDAVVAIAKRVDNAGVQDPERDLPAQPRANRWEDWKGRQRS